MKTVILRMRNQIRYRNASGTVCKILSCFFFLFSCATNQVTDITKAANYKLGNYNVLVNSPKGYCVNQTSHILTKKSLKFVVTDCVDKASLTQLTRRPISSIISVNLVYEPGLKLFSNISDLVEKAGGVKILESILNEKGTKIKNSVVRNGVLFLSLEDPTHQATLNMGKRFWKALTLRENILIIFTSYGFSQKSSNYSAHRELEKKLKAITKSITISKFDLEKLY